METQYKDLISHLTSDLNTPSVESEINNELQSCEMTLNQVCYLLVIIYTIKTRLKYIYIYIYVGMFRID